METQKLISERLNLVQELQAERLTWLSDRALSGFANTDGLDPLLEKLHDLDAAILHGSMHNYD